MKKGQRTKTWQAISLTKTRSFGRKATIQAMPSTKGPFQEALTAVSRVTLFYQKLRLAFLHLDKFGFDSRYSLNSKKRGEVLSSLTEVLLKLVIALFRACFVFLSVASFLFCPFLASSLNLSSASSTRTMSEGINVIIPMGGIGSRFRNEGYRFPKPLINIGFGSFFCSLFIARFLSFPSR